MALSKLYEKIVFHNDTDPALNEDNLNKMSKAIDDLDDRLISIIGTIAEELPEIVTELEEARAVVSQIAALAAAAEQSSEDAEAWAVGTVNGSPVPPEAEQYENSAKYWANQSGTTRISDAQWADIENII